MELLLIAITFFEMLRLKLPLMPWRGSWARLNSRLDSEKRRRAKRKRRTNVSSGVEKLVFYCRTTSVITVPCTFRGMCCPALFATYCAPCHPLLRAFSGWVRSPTSTIPRLFTCELFTKFSSDGGASDEEEGRVGALDDDMPGKPCTLNPTP